MGLSGVFLSDSSVYLPVYLPVCLSVCLSVHLSASLCLSPTVSTSRVSELICSQISVSEKERVSSTYFSTVHAISLL